MDFDADVVSRQLQYTGMLETVKIRQAGYPCRFQINVSWPIISFGSFLVMLLQDTHRFHMTSARALRFFSSVETAPHSGLS